jgi:hypothetical protein
MNGPPLVIYGSFLPASLAGMWGYRVAGLWTPTVNRYYSLSFPFVIAATLLGRAINRRMDHRLFLRWVHGGLIAVGIILFVQGVVAP